MPKISALPPAPAADDAGLLVMVSGGVTYSITVSNLLLFSSLIDFAVTTPRGGLYITAAGQVQLRDPSGSGYDVEPDGSLNITSLGPSGILVYSPVTQPITLNCGGFPAVIVGPDGSGTVAAQLQYRLCVGFAAAATTPGSIVAAFPIYDLSGTLIGYVPVYDSIT